MLREYHSIVSEGDYISSEIVKLIDGNYFLTCEIEFINRGNDYVIRDRLL